MFNFLKNCQTVFQSHCTILRFWQQCLSVPISLYPFQHVLLCVFLTIAHLWVWSGIPLWILFAFIKLLMMLIIFLSVYCTFVCFKGIRSLLKWMQMVWILVSNCSLLFCRNATGLVDWHCFVGPWKGNLLVLSYFCRFSFLQGIFLAQGSSPGLPHCRWILYQLSHKGSPRILKWVVYPFSSTSSWPRNRTRVSCIAGEFFTNWAIREALKNVLIGSQLFLYIH